MEKSDKTNDTQGKALNGTITPADTKQQDDIDETVTRQDEYDEFNKGTVMPQPQIQQSK